MPFASSRLTRHWSGPRRRYTSLAVERRACAAADAQQPLIVRSPKLGVLRGNTLSINQSQGTGYVTGPGSLQAKLKGRSDPAQPTATQPAPDELDVTWTHRLDLTFFLKDEATLTPGSPAPGTPGTSPRDLQDKDRLDALRTAQFTGDVIVKHPQCHLTGQKLKIELDAPIDNRQALRRVDAQGDVFVTAAGTEPDQDLAIRSQQLQIQLQPVGRGSSEPRQLLASGHVHATQPGLRLWAQNLDVTLAQKPDDTASTSSTPPTQPADQNRWNGGNVTVQQMTATREVRVEMDDPAVQMTASRMLLDAPTGHLDLFGDEAEGPAHLVRADATLSGAHILMDQHAETLDVQGPGWIDLLTRPENPSEKMTVTWHDTMHFDNHAGLVQFRGQVGAATEAPFDRTRLACEQLDLELDQPSASPDDPSTPPATQPDQAQVRQRLRRMTAKQSVTFSADSLDPDDPAKPISRFRLEGPLMTFDDELEQLHVIGAGRMMIEDYRPQTDPAPAHDATQKPPLVKVSGRGVTLFTWEQEMIMDAAKNDMTMRGNVWMAHRPLDQSEQMQLYCQTLLADLHETGGLGVWLSQETPQPQIALIQADTAVKAIYGEKAATSDHLRYTASDQNVVLWSDDKRTVQITTEGQPTGGHGQTMSWNLFTNEFNIESFRTGVAPIRQ